MDPLSIVNIAAYKFAPLDRLAERRESLRQLTSAHGLKGTILLTPEGINIFAAGSREAIDALLAEVRGDELLANIEVKESFSREQPFERMLVKIKTEIIAFGQETVDPLRETSPRITPRELRDWLAAGKPVTLLDVRNDYEVGIGTFENAVPIGVDHFRHFPDAIEQLPEEFKSQPVVTFCTGGIRCEKAGPFLEQAGFREVYQLDGGILKYFEECGGDYYRGECFVFDKRVALGPDLQETSTTQCYACLAPLTDEYQQSSHYDPPHTCPHCYRTDEQRQKDLIAKREASIQRIATPLPGRTPSENRRPLSVPGRFDRFALLDFVSQRHRHIPREEWMSLIADGKIRMNDAPVPADRIVRGGEQYERIEPLCAEPDVNADIRILYEDDAIVVISKPAPLPMHPCGRFHRNTLEWLLREAFHPWKLKPAHRLDANTSGVVVFSKTRHVAAKLQPQFEHVGNDHSGVLEKVYVAQVLGDVGWEEIDCTAAISDSPERTGGRRVVDAWDNGSHLRAVTRFSRLRQFDDGTTLVEARPLTGRTNQIRLHLQHLEHPIVGDPLYLPGGQHGSTQTFSVDTQPMRLHAASLCFMHPTRGELMTFRAAAPKWLADLEAAQIDSATQPHS